MAGRLLDEVGLTGRDRDGFRTFPDGSKLTIQVAARTGGLDISKLFELEIAQIHSTARFYKPQWQWLWAEHDPEQAGRLLDEVGLTGRDRDGFRTFPAPAPPASACTATST